MYASLRVGALLEEVAAVVEGQLDLEVFDGEQATRETLLFDTDGTLQLDDTQWKESNSDSVATRSGYSGSFPRRIYGRTWLLRLRTTPEFEARGGSHRVAWFILTGGVLLSVCGAGFTWSMLYSRGRALRLAEEMTANLSRAEAESRRLALVASRTASVVMLTDAGWRIEWVNEGFERFFGYKLHEIKGRSPGEFLRGPESSSETIAQIDAAGDRGEPFKGEMLNYTKTRQPRWVELEIQPLKDDSGKVTGFMSLQLDITERKRIQAEIVRKEAEFRFIFESAPLGLSWVWVGPDGSRRRLTNEAHLRIIGLTQDQMGEAGIFRRITHPDDWARQFPTPRRACAALNKTRPSWRKPRSNACSSAASATASPIW